MARKLKFDETVEVAPAEGDPVEDDIAAAEETTADTQADLTETEAQMGSRLSDLEATVSGLIEQNKRLAALVRQNAEMTQVLQRNFKRLAGEPVVTERVSKAAQPAMEEFAHPAPRYQMEAPTHVTERRNGVVQTGDPAGDAMRLQIQMNREDRRRAGGR